MRRLISVLAFVTLWQGGDSWAQFAPVNEMGLSWGHLHLYPADKEQEAKAWLALGGQLGNNLSGNIPITFPGILILINQTPNRPAPPAGSVGSLVDHVAFRVSNLQGSMTKWKGLVTWWKKGNWGLATEPGTRPGLGFVTTPGGVRIEVLEDKTLKVPIAFDHIHYSVPETDLQGIQGYYTNLFGAKPVRGEANTLSMPGGKLVFSKSDAPTATTLGRTLDHIGFNMDGPEALAAWTKGAQAKGAKFYRPPRNSAFGQSSVLDGYGTMIEINKGQRAYFDLKDVEPGLYLVDESGRREGDPPRQ